MAGLDSFESKVEHERLGLLRDVERKFHQIRRYDPLLAGVQILSRSLITVADPDIVRDVCSYHLKPAVRFFRENFNVGVHTRGNVYVKCTARTG